MSDLDLQGADTVRPGDVLAEKYRVDRILGVGGMGMVVAAHHLQLAENVAIKFLLPSALENVEAVNRFAREARAAVRVKSEHVARVIDVGTLPNGAPYMVMEYLSGSDLGDLLAERGTLPVREAVDYILQASEAIAEAHSLGIVHRDLKPANLFVVKRADGSPCVKVLDFGISKFNGGSSGVELELTKTMSVMGSPLYMSPEQMQSARNADSRSDIWSLGIILYELIAGDVPFLGDSLPELCLNVVTNPPPSLRDRCPDVSPELEAVVFKALEKDREKRYQNLAELAVALTDFAPKRARASIDRITGTLQSAGLSAGPVSGPLLDSVAPPPETRQTRPRVPRSDPTIANFGTTTPGGGRGHRKVAIAGIAAAALLAVGGVFVMSRTPDAPAPVSAVAPPAVSPPVAPVAAAPAPAAPPPSAAPVVAPAVDTEADAPVVAEAKPAKRPVASTTRVATVRPKAAATPTPAPAKKPAKSAADVFDDRK